MMKYKQQIKEYKEEIEKKYVRIFNTFRKFKTRKTLEYDCK